MAYKYNFKPTDREETLNAFYGFAVGIGIMIVISIIIIGIIAMIK